MNNELQEIINYLLGDLTFDRKDLINDISMECHDSMGFHPDELRIMHGNRLVGDLDSYNK